MFDRYTEKARRVIFFARYEASQFGSPYIETEHLLLGLLREDKTLANRWLRSLAAVDSIRKQIEAETPKREKTSVSVDLPLSFESKRVLAYGSEEAESMGHQHIGTGHLLLGVMREEKCFAARILRERGIEIAAVREALASDTPQEATPRKHSLFSAVRQAMTRSERAAPESLKERYADQRRRMESEQVPFLDAAALEEEIARRKGIRS
jgi:ATP-dependent Clp protease ATP-binding subunit ClpC